MAARMYMLYTLLAITAIVVASIFILNLSGSLLQYSAGSVLEVHHIVAVESASPQTWLLYPPHGCGETVGWRVVAPNGSEEIVLVNLKHESIMDVLAFPFSPSTMGAFRGLGICNGTVYLLTMPKERVVRVVYEADVPLTIGDVNVTVHVARYFANFTSNIYTVDKSGMKLLASIALAFPSMVLDEGHIVLVGFNGTMFYVDEVGKHWWHPMVEILDSRGGLIASATMPWNVSNDVLGGILVDTRLIALGNKTFLAVFGSQINPVNLSDKPRRLLLGLFRVNGSRIEPLGLFVLPGPGVLNVLHALLYNGKLYVLYCAPRKRGLCYPEVYVYVREGKLAAVMADKNIEVMSGYLFAGRGRVYAVLFVPLLASSSLLPSPHAAATVSLHEVAPGFPRMDVLPVKPNGAIVDWDFTQLDYPLRDLDGDKRLDIIGKAFSVFTMRQEVYLVDVEAKCC